MRLRALRRAVLLRGGPVRPRRPALKSRGGGPKPLADYDEALRRSERDPRVWAERGYTRHLAARWNLDMAFRQGAIPDASLRDSIREAIGDFGRMLAISRNPGSAVQGTMGRGMAQFTLGRFLVAVGEDPSEPFRGALADWGRAAELDPATEGEVRREAEACRNWLGGGRQREF